MRKVYINMHSIEHSITINIETELAFLEKALAIIMNYENGLYVRGKRHCIAEKNLFIQPHNIRLDLTKPLPRDININIVTKDDDLIASGYNLVNNNIYDTKPYHAVLVMPMIIDIFNFIQYNNNPYKHLYYSEDIYSKKDFLINFDIKHYEFIEDIVKETFVNINDVELRCIADHIHDNIITKFETFLNSNVTAYYSINVENENIHINKHCDIRAMRYMMALDKKKDDEDLAKEIAVEMSNV